MVKNEVLKIVVVVGPTASGKSDLGIFLAKKFGGEIISADSRQVYRGMDVGTGKVRRDRTFPVPNSKFPGLAKAKPRAGKNQKSKFRNYFYSSGIRHHLVDVVSPKKVFTVSDFKKLAQRALFDIASRNKLPIIVGGTGFYVDALVRNFDIPEIPPDKKLRARFDKLTLEHLFKMLQKLDPRRAGTIDSKNKRRLIRALEIIEAAGKIPPLNTNYSLLTTNYNVLWLGLKQKNLEERIKERLDKRLKQGMIKEVKNLLKKGVGKKRLYDLGLEYRWISRWLIQNSKIKIQSDNAKLKNFKKSFYYEKLLREIVKYSKRQMTWFKRNKEIHWVNPPAGRRKEAVKLIREFLSSRP